MNAALEDEDVGTRSVTVSNLMSNHGPVLPVAIPLLAKAMHDETERVRSLAENALSRLGRDMAREDAERLEEQLRGSPHELATRILLLAFYFLGQRLSPSAREARHKHIVWIIRNAPESHTAGSPEAQILERAESECYAKAKRLWLEQVEHRPTDARVAGNAASFFVLNDKKLSESLFLKARALEPHNPNWSERLGYLYLLECREGGADSAMHAQLAFREFRIFEETRLNRARGAGDDSSGDSDEDSVENMLSRIHALPDLARSALAAGDFVEARRYASELLTTAQSENLPEFFRNDGNAIHYSNLVLGQCALRTGDIEQAKQYLLASGRTKGSPNLSSFGPNMSLARELLEKGERDVVLDYFDLCRTFWQRGTDDLEQWAEEVRQGKIPEFGANLHY